MSDDPIERAALCALRPDNGGKSWCGKPLLRVTDYYFNDFDHAAQHLAEKNHPFVTCPDCLAARNDSGVPSDRA